MDRQGAEPETSADGMFLLGLVEATLQRFPSGQASAAAGNVASRIGGDDEVWPRFQHGFHSNASRSAAPRRRRRTDPNPQEEADVERRPRPRPSSRPRRRTSNVSTVACTIDVPNPSNFMALVHEHTSQQIPAGSVADDQGVALRPTSPYTPDHSTSAASNYSTTTAYGMSSTSPSPLSSPQDGNRRHGTLITAPAFVDLLQLHGTSQAPSANWAAPGDVNPLHSGGNIPSVHPFQAQGVSPGLNYRPYYTPPPPPPRRDF